MTDIEPTLELSLVDVQLAFAHWRRTRAARESTPQRLKKLAVGLLASHTRASVSHSLAINSSALKHWADADVQNTELVSENFIELDVPEPRSSDRAQGDFIIHLTNGVRINTQGQHTLAEVLMAASSMDSAL